MRRSVIAVTIASFIDTATDDSEFVFCQGMHTMVWLVKQILSDEFPLIDYEQTIAMESNGLFRVQHLHALLYSPNAELQLQNVAGLMQSMIVSREFFDDIHAWFSKAM